VKSKRIWVAKDYDIGYKSKSHMAEFSPNPDGRNKRDTSINEYKNRLMITENSKMENRISVNKLRDKNTLAPFLEQNVYEEIVEESELEGQDLFNFLIGYDMDISLEENMKIFKPSNEKNDIYKIIIKNNKSYIKLRTLSNILKIDLNILLKTFENIYDKNKQYFLLSNNIEMIIIGEKRCYLISYSLVLLMAYNYKNNEPNGKLNQDFFLLITHFKEKSIGLLGYFFYKTVIEKRYFELFYYHDK